MKRLKFLFDEEEKEEEKIGWEQRMRGIGELPEIPKSTKLKFTADIGLGVGAKAGVGITLPETEEIKPSFLDIGKDPKMQEIHKINFESFKLWFKELKESKDKVAFLKGEGQSTELKGLREQYNELAPYMFGKSEQWIENVSMIAVGVGMAWQLTNAAVTSGFKIKGKVLNAKEIEGVLRRARAAYVTETGKFKATLSDNDFAVMKQLNVFFKTSGRGTAARRMLEKVVEKTGGLSFPQQVNIFGGKLYAGLPADEIVKSLVEAGKVTTEMVKGLDPVKVSQVTQQLLNINPALANEFLKAVEKPKVKPLEETISGLPKKDESLLKKIDQGLEYDLKAEIEAGVNISNVVKALKKGEEKILKTKVKALKIDIEEKGKVGLFGEKKTTKWIEDFKKAFGRSPTDKELKEIATEQLTEGYEEIGGKVEPDIKFIHLEKALKEIEEARKPAEKTLEMFAKEEIPKVEPKEPPPTVIPEVKPEVITDPARIQEIKNSIAEGELILKTGKSEGRKFSADELTMVQRSVDSAKRKIGLVEPAKIPKVEVKAPWQMTKKEYLGDTIWIESAKNEHISSVMTALREGKTVPPEVLADYPELKVEPKPPVEPAEKVEEVLERVREPITKEEIPKVGPKKEDFEALETTDKKKELFYEKYNDVYTETKKGYDRLIDERVADLKEEGFKGVDRGGLRRDEEGRVIGKIPAVSRNPKWYRDFYAENKRSPNSADLKEIAREQLAKGHTEDYGEVPANDIFVKLEAQLESYETILSDIKSGDYSFETPKNVEKLNEKLKELKKENKKLIKDLKTELTTLKAEREAKYVELKKEVEVGKKVEVEVGVKKGVKEVFVAKKLKGLSPEEYKKGNIIMGQINKIVNQKGLTDKEYTALKSKYGYSPHLATATKRMSIPQLEAVLKAVNRARPKIIGHKKVITPKTEGKIQSLKENLIGKLQMSEEAYQGVLKDVGVYKEPKYIDGKHFITEEKGKDVIYRLIDEANILRSTLPYDKAVEKHPVIKKFIDREKAIIGRYRDRTMKDPREWNSMRVYAQKAEEITGAPVYRLYQDLIDVSLENKEKLGLFIREFEPNKKLMKDLEALKRVTDYVGSKSTLKDKPAYPKDITAEEVKLAKKVEDMLIDYRARSRTQKFLDNIENLKKMPQYIEFKKEMDKAKDIYESKGYDDLVEYMKTQVWGIIRNGYDPDQVWSPKIRMYKPAPQTFGKHNIKVRVDIEYHEQERNIIERLFSYKKSMDNLVEMRPKVRAFITLMDQNLDKFSDPKRVQEVMEVFLRELKGYNKPEGLIERILNRAYAQAMQVIIMPSLVMFGRNCLQNLAFGYDKTIIIDPRNKKLSESRIKYMNTYISQLQSMKVDWFMIGEKPLGGKIGAFLIKMVNKVGIYPYSDQGNRHLGFWGKINQVDRPFKGVDANSTEKQLRKAMKGAKFDDIERTERIMALEILANDGYEDMARYVARCYVADTEFQYNRAERSPMEMGRGKWLSNLMLFPRSYWEMLLKMGNKFKTGNPRQKARAFKVLASIIVGSLIVGEGYKKVTGRRKHPYNPLVLLAYEPGGLAIGTVEAFSDVITNTILVLNGDERAATTLATAIPRLSDMMIPFYDYTLRAIEATVPMTYRGQHVNKRIDVLALRVLRKLVTERMREIGWNVKGYKPTARGHYVERNFYQKLQYVIAGAGVDIGIKEREKKKVPLKITIPKGEKLKFTIPEIKKSTKLKFTF